MKFRKVTPIEAFEVISGGGSIYRHLFSQNILTPHWLENGVFTFSGDGLGYDHMGVGSFSEQEWYVKEEMMENPVLTFRDLNGDAHEVFVEGLELLQQMVNDGDDEVK